jgi:hypothetical protein
MIISLMDTNSKGAYAEYMFACECLKHGFYPSFPILDSSVYDVLVDTGSNIIKVQVKYTAKVPSDRNSVQVPIMNGNKVNYTLEFVDYFAIYSEYFSGFFIIKNTGSIQGLRLNSKKGSKYASGFNNFSFNE